MMISALALLLVLQDAPDDRGNPPVFSRTMAPSTIAHTTTLHDCHGEAVTIEIDREADGLRLVRFQTGAIELSADQLARASTWLGDLASYETQAVLCTGSVEVLLRVTGASKTDGSTIERGVIWERGRIFRLPTPGVLRTRE